MKHENKKKYNQFKLLDWTKCNGVTMKKKKIIKITIHV